MSQKLSHLRLGPIDLDFPVVAAPLAGYSDWPARVIAKRLGAPYSIAEVLLAKFVLDVTRGRKARRYICVTDSDHPVGGQLMGNRPDVCARAAGRLVEAGFDCVELNFGCPVKKVVGRCRGGYLLGRPQEALEIVGRVREAVPPHVPVTVKMRRGMDLGAESRDHFFVIFDGAFRLGAAAVTVHGRTVRQGYQGRSSWDFLGEVKRHAGGRTVLGSGDLFTAEDCLRMIRQTGVDGVTAARGSIGNPWIFQQARALDAGGPLPAPPSLHEQRDVIAEHYRLAEEYYGPALCCRVMRKVGIKYSLLHPAREPVRRAFVAVRTPDEWRAAIGRWYAEDLPGRYPSQGEAP